LWFNLIFFLIYSLFPLCFIFLFFILIFNVFKIPLLYHYKCIKITMTISFSPQRDSENFFGRSSKRLKKKQSIPIKLVQQSNSFYLSFLDSRWYLKWWLTKSKTS
jgi:hypothetical protein